MSASDIAPSVDVDLSEIKKQAAQAAEELIDAAGMKAGTDSGCRLFLQRDRRPQNRLLFQRRSRTGRF